MFMHFLSFTSMFNWYSTAGYCCLEIRLIVHVCLFGYWDFNIILHFGYVHDSKCFLITHLLSLYIKHVTSDFVYPFNLTASFWTVDVDRSTRSKPAQTLLEHAKSILKGPRPPNLGIKPLTFLLCGDSVTHLVTRKFLWFLLCAWIYTAEVEMGIPILQWQSLKSKLRLIIYWTFRRNKNV